MGLAHRTVYRASGGRLLGRVAGMPVLLLVTTGRRSGRRRTTPLTYFHDGHDLVLVGSFGGSDLPPGWLLNLRAEPHAVVHVGARRIDVRAREATAAEHERLWPQITGVHPGYARYQRRTARRIPIVLLTPPARAAGSGHDAR